MPLHVLDNKLWFPPVTESLEDGLLAIGGNLSTERLLLAYKNGIFPWYEGDVPLWWSPNPRCVLYPQKIKISKSMQKLIAQNAFHLTINQNFEEVIHHCKSTKRKGQHGTWITQEVEHAYIQLHKLGYACSAEAWNNKKLVGGLYGIKLGNIFFGESMFSFQSNASKFAFIKYVQQLQQENVALIDCQVHTTHLESLGAEMISRKKFLQILQQNIAE